MLPGAPVKRQLTRVARATVVLNRRKLSTVHLVSILLSSNERRTALERTLERTSNGSRTNPRTDFRTDAERPFPIPEKRSYLLLLLKT
jgi:hypothetical protein